MEETEVMVAQIIPQTMQERIDMYMNESKERLASMLAQQDLIVNPLGCKESYTGDNLTYSDEYQTWLNSVKKKE
jgi:hypothetical protein